MAWVITNPAIAGIMSITSTDAGYTPPNGSSTLPSPPMTAGMIVKAVDPTYGEGEFILLKGVASTIVGSVVRYNAVSFATTLAVNTAVQNVPVAAAMSANTSSSEWGWYQISGTSDMAKTNGSIPANVPVYLSATAGKVQASTVASTNAGRQIVACRTQLLSTGSTTGTVLVTINRPHLQSQIT